MTLAQPLTGSRRDVRRSDETVGDRVGASVGQHRAQRLEIALLIEPGVEHDARPTTDWKQEVEADPGEWKEPVDAVDDSADALRGRRRRLIHLEHPEGFDADSRIPVLSGRS